MATDESTTWKATRNATFRMDQETLRLYAPVGFPPRLRLFATYVLPAQGCGCGCVEAVGPFAFMAEETYSDPPAGWHQWDGA